MTTTFNDLPLNPAVRRAVAALGFVTPLPVQEQAIPLALERRDIVGCAPTGTGKTLAYLIPILDALQDMGKTKRFRPRALVLVPTRELAVQVGEVFTSLGRETGHHAAVVYGGVDIGEQDMAFQKGADIAIATPGRLLEHLSRGGLKLSEVEYLVIDEADRLFDAGFLPDLRRIIDAVHENRQTLLFSATMPPEMERFAHEILTEPARVQIGLVAPKDTVEERSYAVVEEQKIDLLKAILAAESSIDKVLLFVRTRAKAVALAPVIKEATGLEVRELHSDLPQNERLAALDAFRRGEARVLVATDVASRGLDIELVSHVVNIDVPNMPDEYIHRVGRTGRVDRHGVAITLVSPGEMSLWLAIEDAVRRPIRSARVPGFAYIFPEDEWTSTGTKVARRRPSATRSFREVQTAPEGAVKENPFTKSGRLKRKFSTQEEDETKQRRGAKKRNERKIKNKKLPHQKNRGRG